MSVCICVCVRTRTSVRVHARKNRCTPKLPEENRIYSGMMGLLQVTLKHTLHLLYI